MVLDFVTYMKVRRCESVCTDSIDNVKFVFVILVTVAFVLEKHSD